MDDNKYKGYIKDYDGGTLMECVLRPKINYLNVPGMIKVQREAVYEKIQEISNSHIVHPGIEGVVAAGKNAASAGIVKSMDDIPGLKEAGWKATISDKDLKKQREQLRGILESVKTHDDSWPFLDPVDTDEVADYLDVIKEPIDLQTIDKRMNMGFYRTRDIFVADMRRMFDNCRAYNRPETEYYGCANNLEEFFKQQMQKLFSQMTSSNAAMQQQQPIAGSTAS